MLFHEVNVLYCGALTGCVVYNMLYVAIVGPISIGMLYFLDIKWRFPMQMFFVYLSGRLIFALAPTIEIQVLFGVPLIAIGYFWAHLCFTKHFWRDLSCFLLTIMIEWVACFFLVTIPHIQRYLMHVLPWTTAIIISVITLYRFKQWLWIIGLVWSVLGVIVMKDGYQPGPRGCVPLIFYVEALISIPATLIALLRVSMKGEEYIIDIEYHAVKHFEKVGPSGRVECDQIIDAEALVIVKDAKDTLDAK